MSLYEHSISTLQNYINSQGGIQLPNRYHVTIKRKDQDQQGEFICSMSQLPSRRVKAYADMLSGVASPIGMPYGVEYVNNLMEFVIEESFASRKYFEDWISSLFTDEFGHSDSDYVNRINFVENATGEIKIEALSVQNRGNSPKVNARYKLYECFPLELIPTKFDETMMNSTMKFTVNMFYSRYTYDMLA
jgi:hypothetical protein